MDSYRTVYDHPAFRGAWASLLLVFGLWGLFVVRGNDPSPLPQILQPVTAVDWGWMLGAVTAAHVAGFVSGYLRTSIAWPALSIMVAPLYWSATAGVCAAADATVCQAWYAPLVFSLLLVVAFALPIVLLSGLQLSVRPRRKDRSRSTWPQSRARQSAHPSAKKQDRTRRN